MKLTIFVFLLFLSVITVSARQRAAFNAVMCYVSWKRRSLYDNSAISKKLTMDQRDQVETFIKRNRVIEGQSLPFSFCKVKQIMHIEDL
ncbi:hypothetical protein L596_022064 [Steinernema carpocapsae]|uniref:Uncharacterized protein n=1 Tax=Steinernema carpocapsae TaxID=34508 RepID=A0A4V6A037_STECR|nr:hypothetical protein L596_022064 [Steinernema carpocapsae]